MKSVTEEKVVPPCDVSIRMLLTASTRPCFCCIATIMVQIQFKNTSEQRD